MNPTPVTERLVCSARGCRTVATWALRWNNPRLHTLERRKTWLACADHRTSLADFLSLRGFLRDVVPVDTVGPASFVGPADGARPADDGPPPQVDGG